jgi:hypothetical protein
VACAVVACALFTGAGVPARADAPAPPPDPAASGINSVAALFALMARSPGLFARFHEEKQIALLVLPIKSDGTLHFERKHGLAKHTLSPRKQSVLLSGSALTMWDGSRTETVPLQSSAPLRALAQAFSLMLAADRAGLEKSFSLGFHSAGRTWQLALVPTDPELKKLVTEIDVAGDLATPKTLLVREASGDVGTTTLEDVDFDKHYTDGEAAAVFKVPPATP